MAFIRKANAYLFGISFSTNFGLRLSNDHDDSNVISGKNRLAIFFKKDFFLLNNRKEEKWFI